MVEPDEQLTAAYALQVDPGEAGALALASRHPEALLLINDARGRNVAQAAGFRVLGTLGLLLRAKRLGIIPAIRPEIDLLCRTGIYLSPRIIKDVLDAAGEGA